MRLFIIPKVSFSICSMFTKIVRLLLLPATKMYSLFSILFIFSFLLSFSSAQFQFFEQMFSGNAHHHHHQQQQQPQNVASDSAWYRQTYDGGTTFCFISITCFSHQFPQLHSHHLRTKTIYPQIKGPLCPKHKFCARTLIDNFSSLLLQLPLSIHPRVCAFSASLSLRVPRQ